MDIMPRILVKIALIITLILFIGFLISAIFYHLNPMNVIYFDTLSYIFVGWMGLLLLVTIIVEIIII